MDDGAHEGSAGRTGTRPRRRLPRGVVPAAVLLALALSLPSLFLGFSLDDYLQLAVIEGWYDVEPPPLELYGSFLDVPNTPWWTPEDARVRFWRPLSSALLYLDHALFGRHPLGYHLHSFLWLAAYVGVAALLFRRLPRPVGIVALVLLAVDEAFALPAGVICNRHSLVSAVLGFLGLEAHLRYREEGWRPGRWLALLALAAALAAGETALSLFSYFFTFELLAARGGWRRRLRALTPIAGLAAGYLLFYLAMDFGPEAVRFYLDPLDRPFEYLWTLGVYLPAYAAGALAAMPASLWWQPAFRVPLIAVGTAALLLCAALARPLWPQRFRASEAVQRAGERRPWRLSVSERRALRWWLPGALLSFLPLAAASPTDRQLLVPLPGIAVLLAVLLIHGRARWQRDAPPRHRRLFAGAGLTLLALLHLGVAPVGRVVKQVGFLHLDATLERLGHSLATFVGDATPEHPHHLVVLGTGDFLTMVYPPWIHDFENTPGSMTWNVLTAAPHDLLLTRDDPRTLTLTLPTGSLLDSELEQLFRHPDHPLRPGTEIDAGVFRVQVLDVGPRGPTGVRFRFRRDLDDPRITLLGWHRGRLVRIVPPPVGETRGFDRPAGGLGFL